MSDRIQSPGAEALERALYYERKGRPDAALAAYLQALEDAPDDLDIAFRTATALLRAGHLDEAQSQLRRIVFIAPDNIPARANLGNCQYLAGDMENAEANFRSVLAEVPENRNALYGFATVLLDQDKYEEALAPADQLVKLLPDSAPARTLLARAQSRDTQGSAAIASYRRALELDPTHLPAMIGLSRLYLKRRRYDEAAVLAARAQAQAPKAIEPLQLIAEARQLSGDFAGAREAYLKALEASTSEYRAQLLLGLSTCLRKSGEIEAALVEIFQAYQLAPQDPHVLNALGACLAGLKQGAMARAILTAASRVEKLPEDLKARIAKAAADAEQALSPTLPDPEAEYLASEEPDMQEAPETPQEPEGENEENR